jgi:hypothetical protein
MLIVAFKLKQFVLARSFKREASKFKSSDKYNCLPIETRQLLYGTEIGKELDYLTKLYLVKAFNVRKIVLEN